MAEQNQGGRNDRDTIAAGQDYEVDYVAKKFGVSRQQVLDAIKQVGNGREAVYAALRSGGASDGGGGKS